MKLSSFLLIILASYVLSADPLIVKSVDGTWLPVIASSWSEKNGGVLIVLKENIDVGKLKSKLTELFPNLKIESVEKAVYFRATTVESLFSLLNGVETGFAAMETTPTGKEKLFNSKSVNKEINPGEVESIVESISFDSVAGNLFINVITQSVRKTLQVAFKMKNGVADPEDEKNKFFGKLLLLTKGTRLTYIPVKIKGVKYHSISNYSLKKP